MDGHNYQNNMGYLNVPNPIETMRNPEMQKFAVKIAIEQEAEVWKSSEKTIQQMGLECYKNMLAEQRDIKKAKLQAENYEKRELTLRSIVVNSDGKFLIESALPNGEKKFSQPVCNESGFKSFWLKVADDQLKRMLKIEWVSLNGPLSVVVTQPSNQKIIKSLENAGVYFRFSRRLKKEMEAAVVAWLIKNASNVEIPKRIGWNQMSNGEWLFEQNAMETWEGLYNDEKC